MSHTAHEVTVGRGDTSLALCQDTHVAAQAWSAGRSADNCSCLDEDFQQSFSHGLQIDLPVSPESRCSGHLFSLCCPFKISAAHTHIFDTSVCTGADHRPDRSQCHPPHRSFSYSPEGAGRIRSALTADKSMVYSSSYYCIRICLIYLEIDV